MKKALICYVHNGFSGLGFGSCYLTYSEPLTEEVVRNAIKQIENELKTSISVLSITKLDS